MPAKRSFSGGAHVETVTVDLLDAIDYFLRYWSGGFEAVLPQVSPPGTEVWPSIAEIAEFGKTTTVTELSYAFRETKSRIYDGFDRILQQFDFLICPTTPLPPFPHSNGKGGVDTVDWERVRQPALFFHRMTEPPSHVGLPVISVPCGFTTDGPPVGLQIIGRAHADVIAAATVQHLAFAYRSLDDQLGSYARLKAVGIMPVMAADGGSQTAFHYEDPDRYSIELNLNNYGDNWSALGHMQNSQ